ncbi:MAG: MBL fold metallo-hydrolase, partial [Planctomycetaceae bacterium]
ARLYPNGPVDLRPRVRLLLDDGSVPYLPDWRWIPTPGHSPGHVSFYREDDGVLIVGDAFVTTRPESAVAMLKQRPELHGPTAFSTCDWNAAGRSVRELAALRPLIVATGHGRPMAGEALQKGLDHLAANFEHLAVPEHGRYVDHPAVTDEDGIVSVPPPLKSHVPLVLAGLGAAAVVGMLLRKRGSKGDGAGRDDGK